jgi:2-aminoadipate transaminase
VVVIGVDGGSRGADGAGALVVSEPMANDTISFARGAPSADILPTAAVRDAAAAALAEDWEKALSYGTGIGHPGLCHWVAERHGGLEDSQVMIANGSLEAGWMLFEHLLEPGDRVVVEQPTYDRTLLMLQRLGVDLVPVPLEDDGLDLGAFEAALEGGPIKLAHVIPNFHNPAGCTLSAAKRVRLVELAAEHGFWIFEDDPYRELPFEGEALQTMLSIDRADRVVHASSFSKTVSPGVRVGYLAGPAEVIAKLAKRANETYISPNMLAESVVLELCRSGGLDENIAFVKRALRERRDALVEALRGRIAEAEFVVPGGGYFLWLDLAEGTDTPALLAEAKAEGVGFVAGPDFMIDGGTNSLRLSFASVPPERIDEGVARIASALDRVRAGSPA